MANVHIQEDFYVPAVDIVVDTPRDILDIMDNNSITPVEILEDLEWELPDFQEAARQLDIELMVGFGGMSSGDGLYQAFKKLDNYEKRVFMTYIADCVVGYHDMQKSEMPNELR